MNVPDEVFETWGHAGPPTGDKKFNRRSAEERKISRSVNMRFGRMAIFATAPLAATVLALMVHDTVTGTVRLENGLVCSGDGEIAVTPGEEVQAVAERNASAVGLPETDAGRFKTALVYNNPDVNTFSTDNKGALIVASGTEKLDSFEVCKD